jgi:hypothetical protein
LVGGKTLGSLATSCKENIRYAQERIQWVRNDKYTWDEIEQSERQQLDKDILRHHKAGKVLTRAQLQQLMRDQREKFLIALVTKRGGGTKAASGSSVSALKQQVTLLQAALSRKGTRKRKQPNISPPAKKNNRGARAPLFCKWCKRAGRMHLIHHHDSKDCNKKPANGQD